MSNTIGRNDPCSCGSGKKHKRCCYGKGSASTSVATSNTTMIILGAVILIGLVMMGVSFFGGGGDGACPPGQSWSAAHGHCH